MSMAQTSFLSEILADSGPIPIGKRAYFQERMRNRLYALIIEEFIRQQKERGLTQAKIAERLEKRPEQITRWLGSPGNWTLGTISDLVLAISGAELDFAFHPLGQGPRRNHTVPDWLHPGGAVMTTFRQGATTSVNVVTSGISSLSLTHTAQKSEISMTPTVPQYRVQVETSQ